eukprot:TRINITY_DN2236_c0_g1_i4.p2 TRINITY_DN2236_c0_g1~~TRINITY_DN2236_c0_g1_i4.p2  ORF type:complete len:176 (-),score=62.92 TRINITY_DN2236_c0_g1_i4:437-964(-)
MVLLPADKRVEWSVPQTLFDAAMGDMWWYMSQLYLPGDTPVPAAALEAAVAHYDQVPMDLNALLIFEQRGSVTSAKNFEYAVNECAQPHYGQRWECYPFYAAKEEHHGDLAREQGRAAKEAMAGAGFEQGGRIHLTTDEGGKPEYFYGPNAERVRAVVAQYDQARVFASCNGMDF